MNCNNFSCDFFKVLREEDINFNYKFYGKRVVIFAKIL